MKHIRSQLKKLGYLILILASCPLMGQEILHASRVEIENRGINVLDSELYTMFGDMYFTTVTSGDQRLVFGDTLLKGNRDDSLIDFNRHDQYFIKMDSSHTVTNYWVIDNCEEFLDITSTHDYSMVLLNVLDFIDADSLAVMTMPDGTEVRREDHLGESILVITDKSMNYLEYRVPTTGRIAAIEGGQDILYMAIEILRDVEYILLGPDTVWNYISPHGDYFPSHVLAGYDIKTGQFRWWNRLGSDWTDYILDLKIDSEENLYALIHPGGFTNYYADTVEMDGGTPPFHNILLKVNSGGEYLWSESFQEAEGEYLSLLEIDPEDNIYVNGILYGDYLTLFDTILYAPNNDFGQGIIIKFDPDGTFQWGFLVAGIHELSAFLDITFDSSNNMYATGIAIDGNVELSGVEYALIEDIQSPYIIRLDRESAKDLGHIWCSGSRVCQFVEIEMNPLGRPVVFLRNLGTVNLLGHEFKSLLTGSSGFLITLSTIWDSIVSTKKLMPDLCRVYPNPVGIGGIIIIERKEDRQGSANIYIVDAQGFVIKGRRDITDSIITVDTGDLSAGVYHLLLEEGQKYQTISFVIQ